MAYSELFGASPDTLDPGGIERGTVGWDTGEHFDLGTAENDGYTFVHVTLFRGRDYTKPLKQGVAQGHKILCQLASGVYRIPPVDTPVIVAIPAGMRATPGAAVILATIEKNNLQLAKNRVVVDYGPDSDVIIRGKSVTISDYGAPARFIMVGPPRGGGPTGIAMMDETGSGFTLQSGAIGLFATVGGDIKGLVQITGSQLELLHKSNGSVRLINGQVTVVSNAEAFIIGSKVALGSSAVAAVPPGFGALFGPTGVAGLSSTSVFISP